MPTLANTAWELKIPCIQSQSGSAPSADDGEAEDAILPAFRAVRGWRQVAEPGHADKSSAPSSVRLTKCSNGVGGANATPDYATGFGSSPNDTLAVAAKSSQSPVIVWPVNEAPRSAGESDVAPVSFSTLASVSAHPAKNGNSRSTLVIAAGDAMLPYPFEPVSTNRLPTGSDDVRLTTDRTGLTITSDSIGMESLRALNHSDRRKFPILRSPQCNA
jgi:hypothetical protein